MLPKCLAAIKTIHAHLFLGCCDKSFKFKKVKREQKIIQGKFPNNKLLAVL